MGIQKHDYWTVEEYLELEKSAPIKHEYSKGEIFAMPGGSINLGMLCGNIYSELRNKLREKGSRCWAFTSEIRIHIKKEDTFVYPDAMVICGDLELSEEDKEAVTNPTLIVEVLSKSTGDYDKGDKFYKYRQLKSFKEYMLIDQERSVVEQFFKKEDKIWEITRVMGVESIIDIKSLGIRISMSDLYMDVQDLKS